MPESPRFLIELQDLDALKDSLEAIARTNKRKLFWDHEMFLKVNKRSIGSESIT
jgi:hypothetical protein